VISDPAGSGLDPPNPPDIWPDPNLDPDPDPDLDPVHPYKRAKKIYIFMEFSTSFLKKLHMTYYVSSGTLNSTHYSLSLAAELVAYCLAFDCFKNIIRNPFSTFLKVYPKVYLYRDLRLSSRKQTASLISP